MLDILDDGGPADERGNEQVRRTLIDILRRAHVLDDAGVHDGDTVGNRHGLLLIVGDVDGGDADVMLDILDDGAHLHAQLCVKVRERLVKQEHGRLDAQRARQRDALLLATGKALGQAVCILVHVHQLHELIGLLPDLFLRELAVLEAELDILADGHMREDRIVLEHHADVALGRIQIIDQRIVEIEFATLDGVEARDHAQQSRLAAARRTKQRKELALFNLKAQIRNNDILAILLQRMANGNAVAHCFFLPNTQFIRQHGRSLRGI